MGGTPGRIDVLHVDDEPGLADVAATFLERADERISVEPATDAGEALDRLAGADVDCVVSDYDLPDRNGIELLEAVREEHPDLPFVLFTGKGSEAVASEAISAGVTDYLQKGTGTEQYELLANRVANAVDAYRSRRTLAERTRRLETLISNLPGMVYRCRNDPAWPMETVEGEAESLTGYDAATLERNEVEWGAEVIHPDDRERTWEAVQDALSAEGSFETTYRILTRDGTTKWVWERGRGVYADGGDLEALEGFITDVTARKERERELRRYERMVHSMREAACIYDEAGRFEVVNDHLAALYGETRAELEGEKSRLVATVRARHDGDPYQELLDGDREEVRGEVEEAFPGAGEVVLSYRLTPFVVDGAVEGVVGVAREVTERRERRRELERTNALLSTLFETLPVGVLAEDESRNVLAVNERLVDLFDLPESPEDAVGADCERLAEEVSDLFVDPDGFVARIDELVATRETTHDEELALADGRTFARSHRPIELSDGDGHLWVYRDVTDRKEREERLQRERDRLDEFASVVSHDLRNPLHVASGRLELAREACDTDHHEPIAQALDRMEALIEDLLVLAREGQETNDLGPVELPALVRGCWRDVASDAATLRVETDRTIRADQGRLRRLVENLLLNAVEHGSTSSRSGADDAGTHGDEGVRVTVGDLDDGFYVADDGPGIPEADRDDVFEAGYSTSAEGTGFGLRIVEQVAEVHGWDVRATESAEGGARFEVTGVDVVE
ncbi:MAG: PAS domain S-box protein [Haloferacaceae archaeon]